MTQDRMPPMGPLAPLVDRMRELARDELPEPRACRVRLWDDGTVDIAIYHNAGADGQTRLSYESATGEILLERTSGQNRSVESSGSTDSDIDVRVIDTVEPPYAER